MSLRELLLRKGPAIGNIFRIETYHYQKWAASGAGCHCTLFIGLYGSSISMCVMLGLLRPHALVVLCNIPSHSINPSSWIMEEKNCPVPELVKTFRKTVKAFVKFNPSCPQLFTHLRSCKLTEMLEVCSNPYPQKHLEVMTSEAFVAAEMV